MGSDSLIITNREEVRKKYGKCVEDVEKDIAIVKEALRAQKHLPEVPTDEMIEFILTNCKYSIEKTKQNFDMYYTIRSLIPETYDISNPALSSHQAVFSMLYYFPLPKVTDTLHRITMMKFKKDTAEVFDPYKLLIYGTNMLEIRLHEDLVMGDIFFVDCEHFKMGHIVKFTPTVFKRFMFSLEKIWSNRIKQIHVINYPPYMDSIMTVARAVMKKKLYERIFLHPDTDSLYKQIPRDLLPSDYGGHEKSLDEMAELWKLKFKEYSGRFDELDKLRVDEALRPEPLSNSDTLGYYGNFKKLDVD